MNSQVDIEIQRDEYGCPFLGGKALKGLLAEECANILYSLSLQGKLGTWPLIHEQLFGIPGAGLVALGVLRVGNATLPRLLSEAVINEVRMGRVSPEEVLRSLTGVRHQTSMNFLTGAAKDKSLRGKQVLVRSLPLQAELIVPDQPPELLQLLSAAIRAFRRAGLGRNRGSGELRAYLADGGGTNISDTHNLNFIARIRSEHVGAEICI